ncbi:succinyl-CoA synthetase subunit beta [Moorella thermoacetica]|uniref:Succinyl-CoA ligase [ADP-forming] subunit beta n=3 Tax=Neomoorella thermoacetica TaxID=1525 RepID=A0A1J5JWN2_NEOTH|nr:ATP-grasp domain-containing protein [Moorella thermoacetica]AKX95787.1 succinyl-CoA ligase [ADP-forming] subunit beta [Moorella thermoacetica]OIQ08001.1 succinyl-CoA ligase [ADP-forming] subunit beta [Moorella thermoacetica]OIQ53140.1 succinyl-CoA ligase [ADP-forming] subunit beta [Moorella thermoacetica]OIQ60828.1 succinyl-CoA ligase [ADP-forming] subunit beta [Moorella thermoacetica]QCZ99601.1 Succinyl-CoA ligase [ADP-forming] subunit beta [Moorella thermoacetica]
MAKLLEYQGKEWLRKAGIPVPAGRAASTPEEARQIAAELGKPVAVKAQVQAGGRGKSGAVKLVNTPEEARAAAASILGTQIKGYPVRQVLVEEKLDIAHEYYVTIIVNSARDARCPMLMFSTEGGMDIESVPEEKIFKLHISPLFGLEVYDAVDLLVKAGIPNDQLMNFANFLVKFWGAYKKYDCFTLETNPLVMTASGDLVAADCKMDVDNSSVYRHPEMGIEIARDLGHEPTELDVIGWGIEKTDLRGSGFVMSMGFDEKSPGYIGYHPIGGGSAMMGMDALNNVNLKPANYADTSGNPVASKIYRVAKVILSQPNIDGYLLGGFMMANQEQWHHAHAVVKVLREILPKKPGLPCVLLLCGNKEEESLAILREGLKDVEGATRVEIYGREHVTDTDFIGQRLLALVKEYQEEKRK